MRFTMNVMDAVKEEHVAPAAKTYLNKWVIRSIAAIMMVMIGGILIDAMGGLEASSAEGGLFSWIASSGGGGIQGTFSSSMCFYYAPA